MFFPDKGGNNALILILIEQSPCFPSYSYLGISLDLKGCFEFLFLLLSWLLGHFIYTYQKNDFMLG